jgi:hypothetical protein
MPSWHGLGGRRHPGFVTTQKAGLFLSWRKKIYIHAI